MLLATPANQLTINKLRKLLKRVAQWCQKSHAGVFHSDARVYYSVEILSKDPSPGIIFFQSSTIFSNRMYIAFVIHLPHAGIVGSIESVLTKLGLGWQISMCCVSRAK